MRRWLPALAYDRPVTSLMVFVALLVLGMLAWARIPLQLMPSGFEPGSLWVSVPFPNGSPQETDEQVVRPIEGQLGTISGIKELESRATTGRASFSVEFWSSVDMDEAYNEVVDRLERALPDLPEEVDRYWIYRYNPNDSPVVWAGVALPSTVEDPYHVMTRLVQPRLERVPGVASLEVWGVDRRLVYIDYDKERMLSHGIDLGEVQRRLAADNFQMASGRIEDRGQVRHVRGLSRIDDVETLRSYPIGDGIVLGDIAEIELRGVRSASINRINGEEAAALAIMKESSANTVEVGRAVAAAFADMEGDPRVQGARFFTFFDQGELITDSLDNLTWTAMTGGAFAVVILFAFLREWRMTLLIAASIPFSLLITVGVLWARGDSLNLLSLMGLMLAVGMVVDNAIVVIETIYRRRAEGAGVRAAAIGGAGEVNLAILASTLTTMVVFLPMILMSEDAKFSFFMGALGLPVVFALAASLVVALFFAPLATRFVGRGEIKEEPRWLAWLTGGYARGLGTVLRRRSDSAVGLLALGFLTIVVPVKGVECTDSSDGNLNDFTVRFTIPPQASPAERDGIVKHFEEMVEEHREAWGVRVYRSRLRDDESAGRLYVYLDQDAPMDREQVMEAAKEAMPKDLPGVQGTIGWDEGGPSGGNRIELTVHGEDTEVLDALGEEIARRVEGMPGVVASRLDHLNSGADEIRLLVDREALERYDLDARRIGRTVAFALRGSELPPLHDGEREIDVVTRFGLDDRSDIETVRDFPIWSRTSGVVPLRALTEVEVGKGPGSVSRTNRRTSTTVSVDLEDDVTLPQGYATVEAALADMVLPRGYAWERGGRFESQEEDDAAQKLALVLSTVFVFLLMGMLFESLLLPLCIITTIPMAMTGATWALWLTGTPFDTMAGVGLVILVGVVVNNGIVLVDLVTQLRADGWERDAALVEAGRRRLRPILMTALTTIFGLIPMAAGSSTFIGIPYAPLARVVIGGLAASTLLTLIFVPFLYAFLDDVRSGFHRWVAYATAGRTRAV